MRTEHSKLFILETRKRDTFQHRGFILADNLDIGLDIHLSIQCQFKICVCKEAHSSPDHYITTSTRCNKGVNWKERSLKILSLSSHYNSTNSLTVSVIYSQKNLEKLRDHIMFSAEKPAQYYGTRDDRSHQDGSISVYNLLNEASLQKIAESNQ